MICGGENILVYHVRSPRSSCKQPKIDTCTQPDWVNQLGLTTMPSASLCICVLLTRVWALASPASALSINCSTVKSSSGSSSEGEGESITVHLSVSNNHKLLCELADYIIRHHAQTCTAVQLYWENSVTVPILTHCSQPAMNKSPPGISCSVRIARSQRWCETENMCVCLCWYPWTKTSVNTTPSSCVIPTLGDCLVTLQLHYWLPCPLSKGVQPTLVKVQMSVSLEQKPPA